MSERVVDPTRNFQSAKEMAGKARRLAEAQASHCHRGVAFCLAEERTGDNKDDVDAACRQCTVDRAMAVMT